MLPESTDNVAAHSGEPETMKRLGGHANSYREETAGAQPMQSGVIRESGSAPAHMTSRTAALSLSFNLRVVVAHLG